MFRFTQTITRELSACASLKLNVDFGYISLFEVIGVVVAYEATILITSYNCICSHNTDNFI